MENRRRPKEREFTKYLVSDLLVGVASSSKNVYWENKFGNKI